MDYVVLAAVFFMSLTSLPVAFLLNRVDFMRDPRFVLIAGGLCLAAAAAVPAFVLRRRYRNVDFVIYVFSMFCWSSFIDLFIGLELDGYVKGFMGFYFVEGEPYLNSSHGTMINYWDGTAHYALQFSGVVLYCMQESYREVGLYWAGSILNSVLVLLPGAVLGNTAVKWSFYLNIPYVALPLYAGFKLIRERPLQARSYRRVPPITRRPVDFMFFIFFILAFSFAVFRGLAILGGSIPLMKTYVTKYEPYLSDPTAFPKVQALVYLFYFSLYYLRVMDGLLNPGQLWMADWAIIHAGASAQSQFSYMTSAIHPRTGAQYQAPRAGLAGGVFWGFNLALLVVPHFFAWRCWKDPDNCGRTYTTDMARPLSQPPSRHSYRSARKAE
ncbi:transmembrane 6 superfamily member 1-like [Babylonia areolata]|uniref:transmembrane 6 superfamily member 1-like n=1 Tax=Babylonia areolata TaxID=304850 RepID=UPI003FD0BECA